jgi:signal transduction histidine kinase
VLNPYFRRMNGMVKFLVLLSMALMSLSSMAQSSAYRDSLWAIANKPQPDTNSVNALNQLQLYFYERGRFDSTLHYALHALPLANALGAEKSAARITYRLGMTYTNLQLYDSARTYLSKALSWALLHHDVHLEVTCYNAFAILNNYQSDYATSIDFLLKAINQIEASNSTSLKNMLPQTYNSISYNFCNEKQYEKAIEYGKKGLALKRIPKDDRFRTMLHLTVFYSYLEQQQIEISKPYLDSAIYINSTLDNPAIAAIVSNNEGMYYQRVNNLEKATQAYLKSYQINKEGGYRLLQSEAADNLSNLYWKLKRYDAAERYATEGNQIGKELKLYQAVASTYDVLKKIASQKGDFKSALHYAEQNKIYADSALNEQTQKITLSLESKYQNEKKEQEIAALSAANAQGELEVVKRNRLLAVGGISMSAALIVLGLFYRTSRQRNVLAVKERGFQQEQIKFLERQQQVVSLQSMVNGQEAERTRIAKDLHDGLGGLFSTVKMYFSTLQHEAPQLKENELFKKSYALVDTASEEVRRIAHNMMPEVLMKLGLTNALKDLCDHVSAGKLLQVSLEVHGMHKRLNGTTEIMLFRIVQELLNNIIKHAHATQAIIQFVRENERLSVIVEDNGRGFGAEEADITHHAGIETVQSRVTYLNGKMNIDSQKNVGTTVMMDFLISE